MGQPHLPPWPLLLSQSPCQLSPHQSWSREEDTWKQAELSKIQNKPDAQITVQIHFEIAECAGDVFLKGNPAAPEMGGTLPSDILVPFSGGGEGTELARQPRLLHL